MKLNLTNTEKGSMVISALGGFFFGMVFSIILIGGIDALAGAYLFGDILSCIFASFLMAMTAAYFVYGDLVYMLENRKDGVG